MLKVIKIGELVSTCERCKTIFSHTWEDSSIRKFTTHRVAGRPGYSAYYKVDCPICSRELRFCNVEKQFK
jgi:phage FluMu protein Com